MTMLDTNGEPSTNRIASAAGSRPEARPFLTITPTPRSAASGSSAKVIGRAAGVEVLADLGGKHVLLAAMGDVMANSLLAQAIGRSGIDVADPQIEHAVEQPLGGLGIGRGVALRILMALGAADL